MTTRLEVGLGQVSVKLVLPDGTPTAWVTDALGPFLRVVPSPPAGADPGGPSVRVVVVPGLTGPALPEPPGWPHTAGVRVGVDVAAALVEVVADVTSPAHRTAVLQLVRGVVVDVALRSSTPLHGAALRAGGTGVFLAGPKGAGKTTLTTAVLRAVDDAAFVTNDKALLTGRQAHGLPFAVLVGDEGLVRAPELRGRPMRRAGQKAAIWPREFASALGSDVEPTVDVDVAIWCESDFEASTFELTPMTATGTPTEVTREIVSFSDAMLPTHVTSPLLAHVERTRWRLPDEWQADVRWFRARGNPWCFDARHLAALESR